MGSVVKLITLALVAVFAAIAANWARDIAYQVNALTVMAAASGYFIYVIRTMAEPGGKPRAVETGDMDDVIRAGVIATAFWGMVGFLAGVYIASELAFPELNWGLSYTSFGRLRPLHTSAVIFAFGGNALICTSFYVVQRTCAARLRAGISLGSCSGATSCSSCWRPAATCWAPPSRANTPSRSGMWIFG